MRCSQHVRERDPGKRLRWGKAGARAALLLTLAGIMQNELCAQSTSDAGSESASNGGCQERTANLVIKDGLAVATIYVNEKPANFIVDTASTTMINSDHLVLPVLQRIRTGAVTFSAAERVQLWDVVYIKSLRIAGVELRGAKILSRSLRILERQLGLEVDGILGQDMLRLWDSASLDYKRHALALRRACSPS
jgi:Aspartyl protease